MSLIIYNRKDDVPANVRVVMDVESAFLCLKINWDDTSKRILNRIEKAQYYDDSRFVDRFGIVLYNSFMSTGCKAALLAYSNPDCVINLLECGEEAKAVLLSHCVNGMVLDDVRYTNYYLDADDCVDIVIGDMRFTSVEELRAYLED